MESRAVHTCARGAARSTLLGNPSPIPSVWIVDSGLFEGDKKTAPAQTDRRTVTSLSLNVHAHTHNLVVIVFLLQSRNLCLPDPTEYDTSLYHGGLLCKSHDRIRFV
ncbi:hypothetical protein BU24DRAFT_464580 [Aaosphaeria arxii CBS 175.79]|uniref:Uncharacterized protein n=1 Tax=Aaosphaeria arxii CBS 175.79 TaxID=1450172 RepID=A0A6A5XM76_9PLEO|nr:uncharacterized protein BU24DRAFT_464580 [Aaosphaeria arxii CBS 175.79]KAF2013850.1 hypothetical protein BU24DRAFT_464580 [Aaosphaeria arxii CBS 175.79]